jgi:hypothetical protein
MRVRVGFEDQNEKKETSYRDERYAVPLMTIKGQRMSVQSENYWTTPPETPECFHIRDPSSWLLPETSFHRHSIDGRP